MKVPLKVTPLKVKVPLKVKENPKRESLERGNRETASPERETPESEGPERVNREAKGEGRKSGLLLKASWPM